MTDEWCEEASRLRYRYVHRMQVVEVHLKSMTALAQIRIL
jgi:hypothetical protein